MIKHGIENKRASSTSLSLTSNKRSQRGVGLLEVMVAMFILAFGALAITNLQTASAVAIQGSADHFKINELGLVIATQLKIDSDRAAAGNYNTPYADDTAPPNAPVVTAQRINAWKATMARSTPNGETQIDCDADACSIGLRWNESSGGDTNDQVFNLRTPI